MFAIIDRFRLCVPSLPLQSWTDLMPREVKHVDDVLLATERDRLMGTINEAVWGGWPHA